MNNMTISRRMGLVAGISLVIMAIVAGFAYGYIFQSIYIPFDQYTTLLNLKQFSFLFRLFIFLFLIVLILDIIVAWALYYFFKEDNESLSLLTAYLRLVYAGLLGISFLSLLSILQLREQTPNDASLIMIQFNTFLGMWSLGLIVFACHLFVLGYLIFTSGYIPKFIGALAILAGLAYLFTNSANLLLPDYYLYKAKIEMILGLPMALGELAFAVWLIAKGGKVGNYNK